MTSYLKHPALVGASGALVVLAAASLVRPLPWPVWAVWGVLTVIGVGMAHRDRG